MTIIVRMCSQQVVPMAHGPWLMAYGLWPGRVRSHQQQCHQRFENHQVKGPKYWMTTVIWTRATTNVPSSPKSALTLKTVIFTVKPSHCQCFADDHQQKYWSAARVAVKQLEHVHSTLETNKQLILLFPWRMRRLRSTNVLLESSSSYFNINDSVK